MRTFSCIFTGNILNGYIVFNFIEVQFLFKAIPLLLVFYLVYYFFLSFLMMY